MSRYKAVSKGTVFWVKGQHVKVLVKMILGLVVLSSCVIYAATSNKTSSLTQAMLKPLIEQQCTSELKASKLWQASSLFLSAAQQSRTQTKVCECVGENAMNDISAKDMLMATVNETAKNELMHHAIMNSLKACAQQVLP